MTRAEVLKVYPDSTEEQITYLLNQFNTDVKNKIIEDSEKKDSALQKELDEVKNQLVQMSFAKSLSDKGITGDTATSIIDAFMKGDYESASNCFGQIIADREKLAVENYEKNLMKTTPDPNGSSTTTPPAKTEDVKLAEHINFGGADTKNQNYYVLGK